jgi:hypothetical protein
MNQNKKNVAHSIFQRLLNRAKINKEDFNLLLSRPALSQAGWDLVILTQAVFVTTMVT